MIDILTTTISLKTFDFGTELSFNYSQKVFDSLRYLVFDLEYVHTSIVSIVINKHHIVKGFA